MSSVSVPNLPLNRLDLTYLEGMLTMFSKMNGQDIMNIPVTNNSPVAMKPVGFENRIYIEKLWFQSDLRLVNAERNQARFR